MREPAPPRAAKQSWWLEEALAREPGEPCPPLHEALEADVVVVGGGYTGMWSAYFLTEREPDVRVVLLDQDVCGGGPSGRNGGFVNGFWDDLGPLDRRYGREGAIRTARAAAESVREIGTWCERHAVDAWYAQSGDLAVSTSEAQDAGLRDTLEQTTRFGIEDEYVPQTPEQVRARCDSPIFRAGVFIPGAATVQPARLARGLRRVLIERGVRVFEHTPVVRFRAGSPVVAETPAGRVTARRGILGVNAWALHWKAFRRSLMVRGTLIVLTAPARERLADIGWTGGEGIYDFRTALHYLRTTPDGRIAFGGSGVRLATHRRVDARFDYDQRAARGLVDDLHRWFPNFRDVRVECAWGGPIDVAGHHFPFFGTLGRGNVHYGLGYTGNGVGPSHLAGKILSGLALGVEDEHTSLPIVGDRPMRFPPEPVFSTGERIVTGAILRKDGLEDEGRSAGPLTRFLAHLPRRLGYNLGP